MLLLDAHFQTFMLAEVCPLLRQYHAVVYVVLLYVRWARYILSQDFFVQEHHLQRAICTGLIIPTPEVTDLADAEAYDKIYPADYKLPRQLIHMQRK